MSRLRLSKHHALGNDFIVWLLDEADAFGDTHVAVDVDPARLAERLCDRHRGIGADGLLIALPVADGAADTRMVLYNADGSRAEMSGNGIRCLVQAIARRRGLGWGELAVATDAGVRHVAFEPDPVGGSDTIRASSTMGVAKVALRVGGPATQTADVDLGNPHLVVVDDAVGERIDVAALGRANPDVNVEVIRSVDDDIVTMEVWERGVGSTEACGTGACAVAIAAAEWGLTDLPVTVRMPGGDVEVSLGDEVTLTGPATWIADIEVMS